MRVLELIRREPGLRPTTAIKQMGITDPSAIRRIRDKYNRYVRAAVANPAGPTLRPAAASPNGQPRRQPHVAGGDLSNGIIRS